MQPSGQLNLSRGPNQAEKAGNVCGLTSKAQTLVGFSLPDRSSVDRLQLKLNGSDTVMSEKDKKSQDLAEGDAKTAASRPRSSQKNDGQSREDRLAEALRANLRRRKSAARKSKAD